MEPISEVILIACAATTLFFLLMIFVPMFKNRKTIRTELERQEAERCCVEFSHEELRATVIDQSYTVQMVGTKTPKAAKRFCVFFETENGNTLSFQVPEEMYDGFEKGQTGLLTIVDGQLYGFAPDEAEE